MVSGSGPAGTGAYVCAGHRFRPVQRRVFSSSRRLRPVARHDPAREAAMNEPFKCPHCGGSKFSVHSDNPETVVCVSCGHRLKMVSRQAQVPVEAPAETKPKQ